ncbi:hypothetical protein ACSTHQ_00030, partial [Vibrio parahaemolyticus]
HYKETYGELIALSDSGVVWSWIAVLAVALVALPLLVGNYTLSLAVSVLIAIVGAIGLNLLTGTTGLISIG